MASRVSGSSGPRIFGYKAYSTRLQVAHFGCSVLAVALVLFAIWPPPTQDDMLPPGANLLTYGYAVLLFVIAVLLLSSRGLLNLSESFLFAPLVLALIGCVSLLHARLMSPEVTTYSSALIPLMLCALPILLSENDISVDCATISRFMFFVLCLASFSHLVWQFSQLAGVSAFPSIEQTFTFCFAMLMAGFFRQRILLGLITMAIVASLWMRPTSTLLFCAVLSMAAIIAYWVGFRRSLRVAMFLALVLMLLANIGILASADFADTVYSAEPYAKQSVLEAHSDNDFRLGVIEALRSETASSSVLFGKYFSGNVLPYVTNVLPWWYNDSHSDYAPIHSDFLIMLSQGGIAGYTLFAILLLGFARLCIKGAGLSASIGEMEIERFFDAVLVMEVIFAVYIMFNPIMQKPYLVAFFFVFVPICVFLIRSLESAMSSVRLMQPGAAVIDRAFTGP